MSDSAPLMHQTIMFGIETSDGDRDCWATPPDLFQALNQEFDFWADLAAEAWSSKCERYVSREQDSLGMSWHGMIPDGRWGFLNCPFSEIANWVSKARHEADKGARIVMVLPAHRCEQPWFHEHVIGHAREVRMVRRRVNYVAPPGITQSGSPFASMVVVFDGYISSRFDDIVTALRGQG